jgi:hypothetical protein
MRRIARSRLPALKRGQVYYLEKSNQNVSLINRIHFISKIIVTDKLNSGSCSVLELNSV